MLTDNYTWNAFLVIRNEEDHIQNVINAIKTQVPPPLRILVANDGSTDRTGEILDSMCGIEVIHYKPFPHDRTSKHLSELRKSLFKEAINGADYVIRVDGDTIIPNQYISEITRRMRRDRVVIASGQDPQDKLTLVAESPTIVDVRWLKKFPHSTRTISMIGSVLLIHASITGFRSAVYTDIHVKYKRKTGANYSKQDIKRRGESFKKCGFSLWYVTLLAIKRRKWRYINGYLFSKVECKDIQVGQWNKKYQREKVFGRLGLRCSLLRNTDTAMYVEPISNLIHA